VGRIVARRLAAWASWKREQHYMTGKMKEYLPPRPKGNERSDYFLEITAGIFERDSPEVAARLRRFADENRSAEERERRRLAKIAELIWKVAQECYPRTLSRSRIGCGDCR
jgi:hypothetical protein